MIHQCSEMVLMLGKGYNPDNYFNGNAVELIYKDGEGKWVATQLHKEYGNEIKFCPFCGAELDKIIE